MFLKQCLELGGEGGQKEEGHLSVSQELTFFFPFSSFFFFGCSVSHPPVKGEVYNKINCCVSSATINKNAF